MYFDVAEEHSSDEGGITVIKVDKPNMAQKGTVSIEKTGEVFSGVNISGEENADVIYQPVYEVKGLAGAVYEITAAEDIITPDGTLRYAKGEVVDTVTTDENGLAKSKEIYLGRYTVVEITAPEGMVKQTFIFIDEIYLLFQHEYSANFLFTLWKRVRKYGAYATGITQNVDDLLQSHTARTMLANSEFLIMLNQASTDRIELAKLLNISDLQLSYITNVDAGHGLIKVGSSLVPFANKFPKNTKLYKLMTTKPGEGA